MLRDCCGVAALENGVGVGYPYTEIPKGVLTMTIAKRRKQSQMSPSHHRLTTAAILVALAFVFGTASVVVGVETWSCVSGKGCADFEGMSHGIFASVGAMISAILGYLFGKREQR